MLHMTQPAQDLVIASGTFQSACRACFEPVFSRFTGPGQDCAEAECTREHQAGIEAIALTPESQQIGVETIAAPSSFQKRKHQFLVHIFPVTSFTRINQMTHKTIRCALHVLD
jgi:hypothetical protein